MGRLFIYNLILILSYTVLGKLSLYLAVVQNNITSTIFAPNGIAMAFVLLFGARVLPGVFIGQFLLAFDSGLSGFEALFPAVGNSFTAWLGAYLFQKANLKIPTNSVKDILYLAAIITLILQPIGAAFGVAPLWLTNTLSYENLREAFFSWWMSGSLGRFLFFPLVLILYSNVKKARLKHIILHAALLTATIVVLLGCVNHIMYVPPIVAFAIVYPMLAFTSAKCGFEGASIAATTIGVATMIVDKVCGGVFRHISPSEQIVYLNIFIAGGAMLSFLVATIYEDKKANEKALLNEKRKLENIAKETPGVVYQYLMKKDGSSYFPYASDGIKEIYGVSPESVKISADAVFDVLHRDDLIPVLSSIQKSFDSLSVWQAEYRINHPSKGLIWVEGRATPKRLSGGDVLWHGFIMDITERKELDDTIEVQRLFLQTLLENAPIPIFYKDKNGLYLGCNQAFEEFSGIKKRDIIGKTVFDLFLPDIATNSREKDDKLFTSPELTQIYEYTVKNGLSEELKEVIFYKRIFKDADGEPQGIIGSILDVTKQKNYENELKLLNEKLSTRVQSELQKRLKTEASLQEQKDSLLQSAKMAELGSMLSAIVHQWKQPLNTINIAIQNLHFAFKNGELGSEEMESGVKLIMSQISFMSKTAEDFQNFHKPSKEKKEFLIRNNIEFIIEMLSKQLKLYNISISVDGGENLAIYGYENEFKQVILNLISNAKDAFENRQGREKIVKIEISFDNRGALIQISDNAGGIKEELLPHKLFESFISTKGSKGTGIGLAMCKTIICEHFKGEITAENIEGGAKFNIYLPL